MPASHRTTRFAAVALTGLLALGACSAADTKPASSSASASAPVSSAAATPTKPTSTAPAPGSTVAVDTFANRLAKSATSFKTAAVDMTIDGAQGTKAKGVMDQTDPQNRKLKLTMTIGAQNVELILVDGTAYMSSPTAPGTYTKIAASQVSQTINNMSPADQIAAMKSSITSVTMVGSENVGGAAADHYKYQASANGAPMTGEVWIDAKDRPVQAKTVVTTNGQSFGTTMTYSNFDAPVTITAPPADKVIG